MLPFRVMAVAAYLRDSSPNADTLSSAVQAHSSRPALEVGSRGPTVGVASATQKRGTCDGDCSSRLSRRRVADRVDHLIAAASIAL